jgi:hypothetical protein
MLHDNVTSHTAQQWFQWYGWEAVHSISHTVPISCHSDTSISLWGPQMAFMGAVVCQMMMILQWWQPRYRCLTRISLWRASVHWFLAGTSASIGMVITYKNNVMMSACVQAAVSLWSQIPCHNVNVYLTFKTCVTMKILGVMATWHLLMPYWTCSLYEIHMM